MVVYALRELLSCQVFCDFGADSQAHCRRNEGVAAGNAASVKAGALAVGRAYAPCGIAGLAVFFGLYGRFWRISNLQIMDSAFA